MYFYNLYNKKVLSDIKFPFLKESKIQDKRTDYNIVITNRGQSGDYGVSRPGFSILDLNYGVIEFKDYRIHISDGINIEYELKNSFNINHRFLISLLHGPFAYLFFQQKFLVLHGLAIETSNGAYIFCGLSESGKSTIGGKLIDKYKLISEDILKISFSDNSAYVTPSFPIILTDNDLTSCIRIFDGSINRNRKIYKLPENKLSSRKIKVNKVFFLNWGNEVSLNKISKTESFKRLISNSFRPLPSNKCISSEECFFKNLGWFVNHVEFASITNQKGSLEKIIKAIQEKIDD